MASVINASYNHLPVQSLELDEMPTLIHSRSLRECFPSKGDLVYCPSAACPVCPEKLGRMRDGWDVPRGASRLRFKLSSTIFRSALICAGPLERAFELDRAARFAAPRFVANAAQIPGCAFRLLILLPHFVLSCSSIFASIALSIFAIAIMS